MSFVSLCRQFGISRKTGYKREDRFQRYGWEGFGDWSLNSSSSPESDATGSIRAADRGKTGLPKLGTEEGGGVAAYGGAGGLVAGAQHGRGRPGPSRAGATSETSTPCGALKRVVCCSGEPQ